MGLSLQERFQQGCLVAESQSSKKTHIEVSGRCKNVNTHFYHRPFFYCPSLLVKATAPR